MSNYNEVCVNELPYEKFKNLGPSSLSDSELLAIFIRTGSKNKDCMTIAKELLGENTDGKSLLRVASLSLNELVKQEGIGEVKAIKIMCMLEISKRISKLSMSHELVFNDAKKVAAYYMESLRHLKTETVWAVLIDNKGALIKEIMISKGTVNSSLVSPREVYIEALKYDAVNIILLHNHPSGDPTPSSEDDNVTIRLSEAGVLIGINVVDHIIIGDNKYYSYAQERKLGRL